MGLDVARVALGPNGIKVNAGMVTSNGRVFAIGDCAGGPFFTHAANDQAGVVVKRALFRYPARFDPRRLPRVTFTDPQIASIGLSEDEALAACSKGKLRVLRWSFHDNDRAQAEHRTEGLVKVLADHRGRILGASIVGAEAGELIHIWSLAIARKLRIQAMADWVAPYPTLGEVNKRAAFRYYATAPANSLVRKVIDLLARLG
jgi:pyruvate/2-oxoglutarate dehydrogenase complex dihydrolipoamide dehydrogenase (E3) component